MKKGLLILLSTCLILACKDNKIDRPSEPDDLLSKDKMVEILYDMALLSAAKGVNKRIIENKGINPEEYVYNKHGIDSAQFARSNEYYAYDIRTYQALYDRVRLRLNSDKEEFNKVIQADKTVKDSLSERNRKRRDSIIKARTEEAKTDF